METVVQTCFQGIAKHPHPKSITHELPTPKREHRHSSFFEMFSKNWRFLKTKKSEANACILQFHFFYNPFFIKNLCQIYVIIFYQIFFYFPIQKFLKIFPKTSSVLIAPVIKFR